MAFADDNVRKITVTGESKAALEAQYSTIHAEIKHVSKGMDQSYTELQQTLSKVIENLKKLGLSDKDIVKPVITQGSEYSWENSSRVHLGYYSATHMEVKVNDLALLPEVYNELSKYDSLTISGTEYGRNDQVEKINEELKKALWVAKQKAQVMADSLNTKLGPVFRIQEISSNTILQPVAYEKRMAGENSGGTFGSVDILATVSVEFYLE